MDLGLKRVAHLAHVSGKLNGGAARAYFNSREAAGGEPVVTRLNIGCSGTVLLAELIGGEPLVEVRRTLVLLLLEQLAERGLLILAALQQQRHARGGLRVRHRALVEFRARHGM